MSETAAPTADGGQGAAASTGAALNVAPVTGTGATSTSAVAATPAPSPAPAASAPAWLDGADDLTVGYVQNKGWTDPKQVLDGYRNLEKLLGADKANNAVIIPKHDADPKEWGAVFDRLGRPTGPDGYKVDLPQGGDKAVQDASLAKFHELGLTKTQGEQLATWYNGLVAQSQQQSVEQRAAQFAQEDAAVKQEWGQAYNQNLAQAQAAARGLGLDSATIDKISDALGHKGTLNLLQKIGSRMGEDNFVTGDNQAGFGNAMTPAQAQSEIRTLMADKDFTRKYLGGDAGAKARMSQLHSFAFPES